MTKKKKNEMPVYGVTCSKCNNDEIVMNTDTNKLVCNNCGQVTEPDLILNSKNFNFTEFPKITVTDESKTIPPVPTTGSDAYKAPIDLNVKVSRNEDNIDILDENTKRLFDMIVNLEAKVDKLATSTNADKAPTEHERSIENTISDLKYKIKLHTQHIKECYGAISRIKDDIDKLTSNDFRLGENNRELHSTISENINDIKALRKDLGDLSVKTKDAVLKAFKKIDDLTYKVNAMKCNSDTGHITTFGDLEVGDKFKIYDGSSTYMKVVLFNEDEYLACNTVSFTCDTMQDDHPVIPINDGDEE